MSKTKIDFIGFNATVKAEKRSGEFQIMAHAGHMELTAEEMELIKAETEKFAEKVEEILNKEEAAH